MNYPRFLEKYHSKNTYIFVRFFINILFLTLFLYLINLFYKDGEFKSLGIYMIFISLLIAFWFVYKKFFEKNLLVKYMNGNSKTFVKYFVNVLFAILLFLLAIGFYRTSFYEIEKGYEIWNMGPFFITMLIIIRVSFDKIVNSIFLSSFKIEENMKFLPEKIEGERILVQYDLFKKITPSEAGFLLYSKADISNLLCIVYKWYDEKIIDIYLENGKKYMKIVGKLNDNVPYYEKFLFQKMLENKGGISQLNKYKLWQYVIDVNDLIFEKCRLKGYCNIKSNKFQEIVKSTATSLLGLIVFIYFIKDFFLFIFTFWWVLFLFFIPYGLLHFFYKRYLFMLTDKGKKVLSEIYGYKYYLEHCEEDQMNSDLAENVFYSKHLPYAIALKLNWKIIDELS